MSNITPLYGETYIGYLLELKLVNRTRYFFQNYSPFNSVTFRNQLYDFVPFEVTSYSESLEIDSESMDIRILNSPTVRNFISNSNDLRRTTVILKTVFPDDETYDISIQRTTVSTYSLSKDVLEISCTSPLTAVNGSIPSKVIEPNSFPQLPYFNLPANNNIIR